MQNYYSNWVKSPKTIAANNGESDWKLLNNIRQDIIGELEAINQYTTHINETTNADMIKYWQHIRGEEEMHVGELMSMLHRLNPQSKSNYDKGMTEK